MKHWVVLTIVAAACGGGPSEQPVDAAETARDAAADAPAASGDIFVDGVRGTAGPECTEPAPCKTIRVAPGSYREAIFVQAFTPVTIVADQVDITPDDDTASVLSITGDARVVIQGARLHGAKGVFADEGHGIYCTQNGKAAPELVLERVTIEDNKSHGIFAAACSLVIKRSTIRRNLGGGIATTRTYDIENTFIVDNGVKDPLGLRGGFTVPANVDGVFRFNTVAGNHGLESSGVATNSKTAVFDSNIVWGNTGGRNGREIISGTWTRSIVGATNGPTGTGNLEVDPKFKDAAGGDYHLAGGPDAPCRDAGDPDTKVAVDYDGDARPAGKADMGADELP